MKEYQLEPEIYSTRMLDLWLKSSSEDLQQVPVHLKLDTGMHRLGFTRKELPKLLEMLQEHQHIRVASIFSHLVASEDPAEDDFTARQFALYEEMYQALTAVLSYRPIRHMLNTAGISRFPHYQMDMVRLGLGLYGIDPSAEHAPLRPISSLRTVISQIKELDAGEHVGYNRAGKVTQPKKIATLAIGYADGFDRRLGNGRFQVLVGGKPALTIGNICMDMCMVDITGIDAEEGDEVLVFGEEQPVSVLARSMGTIPYEVLTGISERVKRVFYSDI
jgi:alanine racemase